MGNIITTGDLKLALKNNIPDSAEIYSDEECVDEPVVGAYYNSSVNKLVFISKWCCDEFVYQNSKWKKVL